MSKITIGDKKYKLEEVFAITDSEDVERKWSVDWNGEDTYKLNVATDYVELKKCFVLVEAEDE